MRPPETLATTVLAYPLSSSNVTTPSPFSSAFPEISYATTEVKTPSRASSFSVVAER
jgi:hypothetical protein